MTPTPRRFRRSQPFGFLQVRTAELPAITTNVAFHPALPELATGFGLRFAGRLDLRGLYFPTGQHAARLRDLAGEAQFRVALDTPFEITFAGLGLKDTDELRIVDAATVAIGFYTCDTELCASEAREPCSRRFFAPTPNNFSKI